MGRRPDRVFLPFLPWRSNGRDNPENRSSHGHANESATLRAGDRGERCAAGAWRPELPVSTPAGLGRRGEPGPESGPAPARDRAAGASARGNPARTAAGDGGREGPEGPELSRSARG